MTYKFTGRLYYVDNGTTPVWGDLSPYSPPQPIPAGSTVTLSDRETGFTTMLKVVPNTPCVCDDHCWVYSHMEGQCCSTLFNCENPDKGRLHHVKVVCVDDILEDL